MSAARAGRGRIAPGTLLLRLATAGVGLFAVYVVYELGRYHAGYDRIGVAEERSGYQQQIQRLGTDNAALRSQLAAFDTLRAEQARERTDVGRELARLQAQIDRDREDLAVYRGMVALVSQGAPVQVQQLHITAGATAQAFRLRLTLMQLGKPDAAISGSVAVQVQGELHGAATSVAATAPAEPAAGGAAAQGGRAGAHALRQRVISAGTGAAAATVAFKFRYYQALECEVLLPAGLQPSSVTVELRVSRKGETPVSQTFPWRVDPS